MLAYPGLTRARTLGSYDPATRIEYKIQGITWRDWENSVLLRPILILSLSLSQYFRVYILVFMDGSLSSDSHTNYTDYSNCTDCSLRRVLCCVLRCVLRCVLQ